MSAIAVFTELSESTSITEILIGSFSCEALSASSGAREGLRMVAYTLWSDRPRRRAVSRPIPVLVPVMSIDAMTFLLLRLLNESGRIPSVARRRRPSRDEFYASRSACRLKLSSARSALTCRSLALYYGPARSSALIDRSNHLALPHCRKAGRRRHGCGLQGRRRNLAPICRPKISARGRGQRYASLGPLPAGGAVRLGPQSSEYLHHL